MLYSACASAKHTSWERDGPNSAPVSEPKRRGLADPRFSDTQSGDMPSLAFTAPFSRGTLRGVVPTRDFRQEIRDIAGIFLVGLFPGMQYGPAVVHPLICAILLVALIPSTICRSPPRLHFLMLSTVVDVLRGSDLCGLVPIICGKDE